MEILSISIDVAALRRLEEVQKRLGFKRGQGNRITPVGNDLDLPDTAVEKPFSSCLRGDPELDISIQPLNPLFLPVIPLNPLFSDNRTCISLKDIPEDFN